jgi:hypothetical protein
MSATIIKLTQKKSNEPIYVNMSQVRTFVAYEGRTRLRFADSEAGSVDVLESPEQISTLTSHHIKTHRGVMV